MKRVLCVFLLLILTVLPCGCIQMDIGENESENNTTVQAVLSPLPVSGSFVFTAENMPLIGCTKAYEKLAYAYAGAALGIAGEELDGYITVSESMTECYESFVRGEVQLILAPAPDRNMSEIAYESEFLWQYTPLGRDALVFICYRGNALNGISSLNLRYLYQACYNNWAELGGYDTPMLIYGANEGSTSRMMFDTLFGVADENVQTEMTEHYDTQAGYVSVRAPYTEQKGSIGYSTYNYCALGTANVLAYSKMLSIDGVLPDRQTINSGAYAYTYDFGVLVSDNAEEDSPAKVMYNWMCSEQGKQLVAAVGY